MEADGYSGRDHPTTCGYAPAETPVGLPEEGLAPSNLGLEPYSARFHEFRFVGLIKAVFSG